MGRSFGVSTLRNTMGKQLPIWFSLLAWIGRCTTSMFGHCRQCEVLPRATGLRPDQAAL